MSDIEESPPGRESLPLGHVLIKVSVTPDQLSQMERLKSRNLKEIREKWPHWEFDVVFVVEHDDDE